jgi:hypothetical protein
MKRIRIDPVSTALGAVSLGTVLYVTSMAQVSSAPVAALGPPSVLGLTVEQSEILGHMSIVYLDDGFGNLVNKTLLIEGINVQIVSGAGTTDATVNGLGNLIVGYNELGNPNGDDRTGSHNIVGGNQVSYTSYGGFVIGEQNFISAPWASISGGSQNSVSGYTSSISGGAVGTVQGQAASISGGFQNVVTPTSTFGSVTGGDRNTVSGAYGSVTGGQSNLAAGVRSAVTGGQSNLASGERSAVSGGISNDAGGILSSVSGGLGNSAIGNGASVSGGFSRDANGSYDWVAGSCYFCDS